MLLIVQGDITTFEYRHTQSSLFDSRPCLQARAVFQTVVAQLSESGRLVLETSPEFHMRFVLPRGRQGLEQGLELLGRLFLNEGLSACRADIHRNAVDNKLRLTGLVAKTPGHSGRPWLARTAVGTAQKLDHTPPIAARLSHQSLGLEANRHCVFSTGRHTDAPSGYPASPPRGRLPNRYPPLRPSPFQHVRPSCLMSSRSSRHS